MTRARAFSYQTTPSNQAAYNITVTSGFGQPDLVFVLANNGGVTALSDLTASHADHMFGAFIDNNSKRATVTHSGDASGTINFQYGSSG